VAPAATAAALADDDTENASDFIPLEEESTAARSVASMIESGEENGFQSSGGTGDDSERVVGSLVHRLLHRFGLDPGGEIDTQAALAILRAEEMSGSVSTRAASELADAVIEAYRAICRRADIRALYDGADVLHEVPFTMERDGGRVRGTIDCLIRSADGQMTVLEFKTGRARDVHQTQLDWYRQAVERLFPQAKVDARLVYTAESPRTSS
jgi:ATP-dependent exoDNAse (exonuclease V) beta subunit